MAGLFGMFPRFRAEDSNGDPLASGTLEFYESGTSTAKNVYSDSALSTSLGSTVTLDSRGEKEIWLDPQVNYRVIVKDSAGTTILTQDNYAGILNIHLNQNAILPKGYINGLQISNDLTDSAHDVVVATGVCKDAGNTRVLNLTSSLTKQIDANWAAGTGNGGFPSALTLSNATWYHVFLIYDPTNNLYDAGFDTSVTATNLLNDATNYTKYRRLGAVLTDSSANVLTFFQDDNDFYFKEAIENVNSTNPGTSSADFTCSVPLGIECDAYLACQLESTVTDSALSISSKLNGAPSTPLNHAVAKAGAGATFAYTAMRVKTNSTSNSRYKLSGSDANTTLKIYTQGYRDERGQYN